jgi:ParB family transcriptional regulator, chromosome partitioning protein
MAKKGGLGRGLGALIPGENGPSGSDMAYIYADQVIPNPRQPRGEMDDQSLEELAESIREHGILQPLIVSPQPGTNQFVLIAGERRLRAARIAGLAQVPVIIRQASDQERLELALIENIQRADLTPLETAEAFQLLSDEFGLRHEDIAFRVGKSRESISNTLRLLKLPEEVKQALRVGSISEGHARALLGLSNSIAQVSALKTVLEHKMTVRQTEELVKMLSGVRPARRPKKAASPEVLALEERLRGRLGTRVSLHHGKKGGSLVIYYYSDEELVNIISQILLDED